MLFAEIILPIPIPRTLTYGVPESLQNDIRTGIRAEVNFGKNKTYAGLVFKIHQRKPDTYQIKPIKRLLDSQPVVSTHQIQFWTWLSNYYCCTLGDIMQAALPAHLKLMNNTVIIWNETVQNIPNTLSDEGFLIAEALQIRKKLTLSEIRLIADKKNHAKAIMEILDLQLAFIEEELKEKYKPKKEKYVCLKNTYLQNENKLKEVFDNLKKAPKQAELLLHFFQFRQKENEVPAMALLKKSGATDASLKALAQKGILEIYTKEISRLNQGDNNLSPKQTNFTLNEEQQIALKNIRQQWQQKSVVLLKGVTGSGKTMIYIRIIQELIKQNKQTLFLLPEIALTTHFVQRLMIHFKDELGVYHSRFSNNERVEIWNKVQNGEYKVVMGARSSIWLPFKNLACVIVDEEHETSYKQQNPAPRFHARDAAIYLASLYNAKVLLGSATPSMESAFNAQTGKYGFASLQKRYQNQMMPEVKAIPASQTKASLSSIITLPLLEALNKNLSNGKQALLFQNKRGYAPFLICGFCGYIPHCPNCDVSMTYHKLDDRLHCHYCGQKSQPIKHCPQCGQTKIMTRSFGTEKIEEDLKRIFPKRKIARMDTDSVRGKNKMNQLIRDFERGSIDILVGTQMIAKGLDFDNVGLVGILNADSLWSYPDFRINERAFQLMEQVSGRSGRSLEGRGQVLIQTFNLKHPLLALVAAHDYNQFYRQEIALRKEFQYPPFSKLIKITLKHRQQQKVLTAASYLAEQLTTTGSTTIQGPTPALVPKIKNLYLFEIRLKIDKNNATLVIQKQLILQVIVKLHSLKGYSQIQVSIDVDPI